MKIEHIILSIFTFILITGCHNYSKKKDTKNPLQSCGRGYVDSAISVNNHQFVLLYRDYISDGNYTYHSLTETANAKDSSYNNLTRICVEKTSIPYQPIGVVVYALDSNINSFFGNDYSSAIGFSFYRLSQDNTLIHDTYIKRGSSYEFYKTVKSEINSNRIYINDIRSFLLQEVRPAFPQTQAYYLFTSIQYNNLYSTEVLSNE